MGTSTVALDLLDALCLGRQPFANANETAVICRAVGYIHGPFAPIPGSRKTNAGVYQAPGSLLVAFPPGGTALVTKGKKAGAERQEWKLCEAAV